MSIKRARILRDLTLILLSGGTVGLSALVTPAAQAAVTGNVQGVVRGENGQPLQGARVRLIGAGKPPIAISDKSGYYTFTGVQPGPYTVEVTVVTYEVARSQITVTQDLNAQVDFALIQTLQPSQSPFVYIAPTRRTDTNTQTTITALNEQHEKSQPNMLYQYMGLLNYKPGVTMDAGQYPHLRGSDLNQIDYLVDGISVRDPLLNQFANNAITVGIQRSNVQTAGQDASYGGATGGYLNQLTVNGRDLKGGYLESTNGPNDLWQYKGANIGYGNVSPDGKLDFAVSSILFKNKFAYNTQYKELHSSADMSGKINYYLDSNNTLTLYGAHGAENYFYPDLPDPSQQTLRLGTQTIQGPNGQPVLTVTDTGTFQQDESQQVYDQTYFLVKHNFTQASNIQYHLFKIHENIGYHDENTRGSAPFYRTQMVGNQLDYYNQFNHNFLLRAGVLYNDKDGSYQHSISGLTVPVDQKKNGYGDKLRPAAPKETDLYLANKYTTSDDKMTLDFGVRYGSTTYDLKPSTKQGQTITTSSGSTYTIDIPHAYTSTYADPRLGVAYSPAGDLTFRSSYSVNSQQPETIDIEYLNPLEYGGLATALNPNRQFLSAHQSALPFNRLTAYHSNDFDLSVEKAFNLSGILKGAYSATLTGYQKKQYDLIEQDQESFDSANFSGGAISYNNGGHGHASGVEMQFVKRQVHPSDWNGYVSYTNQVVRANASLFDTNYTPYFASALAGSPYFYDSRSGNPNGLPVGNDFRRLNEIEFPTGYDQRHTVAVVATKRFTHLWESTFILDAGSGFPFFSGGTSSDSSNFAAADAQHGNLNASLGGNADFTEVPFVAPGTNTLVPVNPVAGRTGWHYKIAINTNFYLTPTTSLFFNVDNVFDRKTALTLAPQTLSGLPYYQAPSAQYPQGKIVYGPSSILTPIFLSFGFRQRF